MNSDDYDVARVYDGKEWNTIRCIRLGVSRARYWYEIDGGLSWDYKIFWCYDHKNNKLFHAIHFACCCSQTCYRKLHRKWLSTKVGFIHFRRKLELECRGSQAILKLVKKYSVKDSWRASVLGCPELVDNILRQIRYLL